MCETPLAEASKSPATAPENRLDGVDQSSLETPRGRYDAAKRQFSLDYKTKVFESSRTWRRLSEVSTVPITTIDVDLHPITNKYFAPTKTERWSISPACRTQRIKCASVKYEENDDVDHTFAVRPQEEGMMQQSSNSP